jgi:Domain of unknown function (DUF4189)
MNANPRRSACSLARPALASGIVAATLVVASTGRAQEWTTYASPEEGFSVEAPGAPQIDHKDFDPKTMAATRDHAWPKPSGPGAYLATVIFRNRADLAARSADAALRDTIADAKRACEELRGQQDLAVAGGIGSELALDKCPGGMSLKARVHVLDERIVAVGVIGTSGVELAEDTKRFLDSLKLTAVVAAQWKSYAAAADGFSLDLPGTPTVKEGGFNPNTFTGGRVHEAQTRVAHYAVTAALRRRDGMAAVPNEQLLAAMLAGMKGDCELTEQRLAIPGGIGAEFVKDKCRDGTMLKGRFYLLDDRLYQLVAAWPGGMAEAADIDRFFSSFRLILAATPAPAAPIIPNVMANVPRPPAAGVAPPTIPNVMANVPPPQAPQQGKVETPATADWGAIAIDIGDPDPSYGIGGGDSEAKAVNNAMRFCRQSGGKTCKIVVTYNACGAYAAARNGSGWGKGASKRAAEAQALEACNNSRCRIVVSDCN